MWCSKLSFSFSQFFSFKLSWQDINRETSEEKKHWLSGRKVFALDFILTLLCASVFHTVHYASCSKVLAFKLSLCFSLWRSCCFSSSFLCRAKTVWSCITVCCELSLAFLSSFLHCDRTIRIMCATYVYVCLCMQKHCSWPDGGSVCQHSPVEVDGVQLLQQKLLLVLLLLQDLLPLLLLLCLLRLLQESQPLLQLQQGHLSQQCMACSLTWHKRLTATTEACEVAAKQSYAHLCVVEIPEPNVRKRFNGTDFADEFKFPAKLCLCLL